ncbi:MAG: hypothetical protein GX660_24405 [Clostridiaceae bacterium]|nr:hypothetical protein [Clostridiaceae bacterium]
MHVTVNLFSSEQGVIKNFLQRYYQKEIHMDDDVGQWIYVYKKPLEAIDMISTVVDNSDKHNIGVFIQVDKGDLHPVTNTNCNDIIKALLYLHYKESDDFPDEKEA